MQSHEAALLCEAGVRAQAGVPLLLGRGGVDRRAHGRGDRDGVEGARERAHALVDDAVLGRSRVHLQDLRCGGVFETTSR